MYFMKEDFPFVIVELVHTSQGGKQMQLQALVKVFSEDICQASCNRVKKCLLLALHISLP